MSKSKLGMTIVGMIIAVISISSCTYRAGYNPGYDYGYRGGSYGYGYRYAPPPPRVIVRPVPPPRVIYRDNGRRYHSDRRNNRNFNRQSHRQYGHNGRSANRR